MLNVISIISDYFAPHNCTHILTCVIDDDVLCDSICNHTSLLSPLLDVFHGALVPLLHGTAIPASVLDHLCVLVHPLIHTSPGQQQSHTRKHSCVSGSSMSSRVSTSQCNNSLCTPDCVHDTHALPHVMCVTGEGKKQSSTQLPLHTPSVIAAHPSSLAIAPTSPPRRTSSCM
uniref:Pyroglutamylated RFamide peptide receptor n=1 Tax=Lygus hesperus TaxID=30085 RepID=A0A0A9XKH6_LYGHE